MTRNAENFNIAGAIPQFWVRSVWPYVMALKSLDMPTSLTLTNLFNLLLNGSPGRVWSVGNSSLPIIIERARNLGSLGYRGASYGAMFLICPLLPFCLKWSSALQTYNVVYVNWSFWPSNVRTFARAKWGFILKLTKIPPKRLGAYGAKEFLFRIFGHGGNISWLKLDYKFRGR